MDRLGVMLEDRQLICELHRGNVDALRLIYDKYKLDLLKLAILLTGSVHRSEDAVQDVFLRLAESYNRISDRGNLRNFLITCLVNRIRTLRRDSQRHRAAQVSEATQTDHVRSPEHWAIVNEQMRQISHAMAELPADQREVVALRFEAGMEFPQIARIQRASVNTVQGRYRYGMAKLRSLLNSEVET